MSINQNDIISTIKSGNNTFWKIVKSLDANEREVLDLLNEMKSKGTLSFGKNISINSDHSNIPAFTDNKCKTCEGKTVELSPGYKEIYEKFNQITEGLAPEKDEYLQGRIHPIDCVSKVAVMNQNQDLHGKDILIIGDDDFASIAIALTRLTKSIHVLEIDSELVNKINSIAAKNSLKITAEVYDVQNKLPSELEKSFDVFVTEPPHTIPSMNTFLSRGTSALREKGIAYFIQTHLGSPLSKWHKLQENLLKMGFAITHIIPQFCTYPDTENEFEEYYKDSKLIKEMNFKVEKPGVTWYTTSLFRAELVKEADPIVKKDVNLGESLYKDEDTLLT